MSGTPRPISRGFHGMSIDHERIFENRRVRLQVPLGGMLGTPPYPQAARLTGETASKLPGESFLSCLPLPLAKDHGTPGTPV
jgi:hypothetical protein